MDVGQELIRKEKVRVIADILSLYFASTEPDTRDIYWHGTIFDNLYEKDLTELYVTLSVYKRTRNKKHI